MCSSVGIRTAGMAYLDEFLTKKNRPTYLTFYSSITSLGAIVQPMIGLVFMTMNFRYAPFSFLIIKPWRLFILLGSLVSAIATLVLIFLPEGPKQLQAMGKENEALTVLQMIYRVNSGRPSKVRSLNLLIKQVRKYGSLFLGLSSAEDFRTRFGYFFFGN